MFDIGWSELLVIAAVALIVIGPKELPGVLRSVGMWMGKIRRMAADFQSQFQEAMREAEMADLKKHADDLNQSVKSLTSDFDPYGIARDVEASQSGTGTSQPAAPSGNGTLPEAPAAPVTPVESSVTPAAQPESAQPSADPAPATGNATTTPETPPPAKGAA